MSRPPLPTALKKLRGTFRKGRARNEPFVDSPLPDPPDNFSEGELIAWKDIAGTTPAGVLTSADAISVELASRLLAEYRSNPAMFGARKMALLFSLLGKFGLNPSDRGKLDVPGPATKHNPFAQFLKPDPLARFLKPHAA